MNAMTSDRPMKRNSLRWPHKHALYSWITQNRERIGVMPLSRLAEEASAELNHKFTISNCRWMLKIVEQGAVDGTQRP
jgi:hypothetical protein